MEFERIADKKRLHFITAAIKSNVRPGERILDVGCGNGIITIAIGQLGHETIGIDSSEKAINSASSSNDLPNVKFNVVPAGQLTAEPGKYSAIICSEVLEHLQDPGSLLSILHESLSSDGILIVTVPNGVGPREMMVTRPVQYLKKRNNIAWKLLSGLKRRLGYTGETIQSSADDLSHLQFFTLKSLSALAKKHGFKIVRADKTNFVEQVFPFSLIIKRSLLLQRLDCRLADILPPSFTSGFMTIWKKL